MQQKPLSRHNAACLFVGLSQGWCQRLVVEMELVWHQGSDYRTWHSRQWERWAYWEVAGRSQWLPAGITVPMTLR